MKAASYGQFSGTPKTEWLISPVGPDRDMRLLEDFWFQDVHGKKWAAPTGSVVNGASIPRALWSSIGSPYTDDYRCASIVHDVACGNASIPREEADEMFYFACLAGGCSLKQARVLYAGVRIGAWASSAHGRDRQEILPFQASEVLAQEAEIQNKFEEVVSRINEQQHEMSFEELDRIVEHSIQKAPPIPALVHLDS